VWGDLNIKSEHEGGIKVEKWTVWIGEGDEVKKNEKNYYIQTSQWKKKQWVSKTGMNS